MEHVLIVGANRGLGLEFARQYAQAGWSVTATARSPQSADALKATGATVVGLDVSRPETYNDLVHQLKGKPLNLYIHCAGIYGGRGKNQTLGSVDVAAWQETFLVNTIAPCKMTEALLPLLKATPQSKAVYISSLMGSISETTQGGDYIYRSSKAALNDVVRLISLDLKNEDIAFAALHPGWVKTDMGGDAAPLTPEDSISGLRKVISSLNREKSGSFFSYDGRRIDW